LKQTELSSATAKLDEDVIDRAIRPKLLADYVGQQQVCEQMDIFIKAAKLRQDALDHLFNFWSTGARKNHISQYCRQ